MFFMRKVLLVIVAVLGTFITTFSQENDASKISIKFDARFDGGYNMYKNSGNTKTDDKFGFAGKYFKLLVDGNISDRFSYSFRHRLYLDNGNTPKEFFGTTDWLYLKYRIDDNFFISAGKEVVNIGGYEYDRAPIDVYFWSDFWNNVNPYQSGVTVGYTTPDNNHTVKLQVTNSPFSSKAFEGIFAYNAIWYGNIGCFAPIYSVNLIEYEKGHFINYISLGNRLTFGNLVWEVDYMNRASSEQKNFFADFSVLSRIAYTINEKFMIFAKGGYDQNKAQDADAGFIYDRYVLPGVKYAYYGLGAEYYPIKKLKNTLRIHAYWYTNNSEPSMQSFNIGLRWRMNVFDR